MHLTLMVFALLGEVRDAACQAWEYKLVATLQNDSTVLVKLSHLGHDVLLCFGAQ